MKKEKKNGRGWGVLNPKGRQGVGVGSPTDILSTRNRDHISSWWKRPLATSPQVAAVRDNEVCMTSLRTILTDTDTGLVRGAQTRHRRFLALVIQPDISGYQWLRHSPLQYLQGPHRESPHGDSRWGPAWQMIGSDSGLRPHEIGPSQQSIAMRVILYLIGYCIVEKDRAAVLYSRGCTPTNCHTGVCRCIGSILRG